MGSEENRITLRKTFGEKDVNQQQTLPTYYLRVVQFSPYRLFVHRQVDPPGKFWQTWFSGQ